MYFYPDDLSVVGGKNAIRNMKLHSPKNVSVAGYDGTRFSQMLNPKRLQQFVRIPGKSAGLPQMSL